MHLFRDVVKTIDEQLLLLTVRQSESREPLPLLHQNKISSLYDTLT